MVAVPEYIADNAQRALDNIDRKGGGVTDKTLRETRLLAQGEASENKIMRMAAWFARHKSDLQSPRAAAYLAGDGPMTAGQWAWLAWGGDITTSNRMRAMEWAERKRDQLEKQLSASVTEGLKRKVKEHNDKYGDTKSKRVNLRMLEAVFRRGVGAYTNNPGSVRPGVNSADQWAYARVNAFLRAVRTGSFSGGKFDTDLLPQDHPMSTRKALATFFQKQETKREDGEDFPAEAFAYVPDPEKPSTWKLRLWDSLDEKETAAQVGRALAALGPGGFRGNRVQLPEEAVSGVKRKVLAAWRRTHPDATTDEEPEVLKAYGYYDEQKDYGNTAGGEDAMTHLLMAYRLMLDHPECAPILGPLMEVIHMKEAIMLEHADETHIVVDVDMSEDEREQMLYRVSTRKVVRQQDGQYCVYSESGRSFGCYATEAQADARLAQIESFADRRVTYATDKELGDWHTNLHRQDIVTEGMVTCHDIIEEELDARAAALKMVKAMSGSVPVAKADEQRFTLAPVYVPGIEDAHGEFTDQDTLQKALWDWMRAGDRTIYLQHSDQPAGEMVELLTWPMPIETALAVPGEGITKYAFPENTPFMGVVWESWAWEMVKAGELRGYSIGGKAQRMEADLPSAALV